MNNKRSRVFRLLLQFYPSDFRSRYGEEMEEMFQYNLDSAGGRASRIGIWLRGIIDLAARSPRRWSRGGSAGGGRRRGSFLGSELRQGSRRLLRQPWQSLFSVVVVGLGMAGSATVFALLQGIVLDPLPYPDSHRLVRIYLMQPERPQLGNLYQRTYQGIMPEASSLAAVASISRGVRIFLEGDLADQVMIHGYTGDLFSLLGVAPEIGVPPVAANEESVVLSHRFWQARFGGDPGALGRRIRLLDFRTGSRQSYRIAAVMPADFATELLASSTGPDLWLPVLPQPPVERVYNGVAVIARLAPAASLQSVEAELNPRVSAMAETDSNLAGQIKAVPLQDAVVGHYGRLFWTLFGAVGCLLAICGLNFSGLLVAGLRRRRSEIAVRRALGARPLRILVILLAESVPLSVAGALLGLVLSTWILPLVLHLTPYSVPRLASVGLSPRVILFSILAAFGVGVAAALMAFPWRSGLEALRSLTSGVLSPRSGSSRLAVTLVTGEMTLAILLLSCGSLLATSLVQLYLLDPGYRMEGILTFSFPQPSGGGIVAMQTQKREVLDRIQSLPGVEMAAVGPIPFRGEVSTEIFSEENDVEPVPVLLNDISPDFHRVLSMELLRGRPFVGDDHENAPLVAIVNKSLADRFWPGQDPIGRRLTLSRVEPSWITVVGLVGDVRRRRLDMAPEPEIYLPYVQSRIASSNAFLAKINGDPEAVQARIRQAISSWNSERTMVSVSTLEELASETLSERRLVVWLLNSLSGISLLLAAVGLYSVTASLVADRTREVGLRMALGAGARDILRLFLHWGLRVTGIGLLVGLPVAALASQLLDRWLFHEAASDLLPFLLATLTAALVAVTACLFPSWRASRLDPLQALRDW